MGVKIDIKKQGIQGPAGPTGATGNGIINTIDNGDGTFTFEYTDGSSFTTSDLTGPPGPSGGGGTGDNTYQMTLGFQNTTLNGNTTYIAGGIVNLTAIALFMQRASRQHIVPRSGSVVNVDIITVVPGAKAGTGTPSIELHNITQSTSTVIVAANLYSSGALLGDSRIDQYTLTTPFSVDKGDIIQIRIVTPSWSTSPGSVWQQFHLDIEE